MANGSNGSSAPIESTTIHAGGLAWDAGTIGEWDGEPVLLLHGFPEHWRTWALVMPALAAEGFRIHAVCLPGYGSTTPPSSYEIDDVADHVAALCKEIGGPGGCHVIGHDWGGIIAAALAASHPDLVRSVVLACCAHPAVFASGLLDPRQIARSWYVGVFQIPGIERVIGSRALTERVTPGVSAIKDAEDMSRALAYYRTNLQPWRFGASAAGRISAPGLVVHAARDVAITERLMRKTSEQLDDLRGFEVLDLGHFVHREDPPALLELVVPFLRSVRGV